MSNSKVFLMILITILVYSFWWLPYIYDLNIPLSNQNRSVNGGWFAYYMLIGGINIAWGIFVTNTLKNNR